MSVAFNSDVDLTVEIAFDSDPFATSQTFSDVSAYIREFSIDRGRQHDLADYQTGTASVLLDNSDDRFNPLNASSPYYGKISPFRQIKISAEYDGSTRVLFRGFITAYPESFGGQGADSSVRVSCVDAFKIFNLNTIGARGWKLGSSGFSNLGESTRLGYEDIQELSSARISRLLDAFGWSSTDRAISTGDLQVQAGQSVNDNLLTAMKNVESAEQGQFYMSADGKATFRDRNYKRTQQFSSQATFGTGVGELPFSDVITTLDDSKILNLVSVTRNGGTEQVLSDTDSIAKYGARENSLSGTLNVTDADALSIAEQRLTQFKETSSRIEGLIVNPLSDTNLWNQVLIRELGDKITIKIPTTVSTTMEFDVHLDRISHTVSAINQTWTWQVRTSAGSEVGSWVLGSSRLGQETNLAW
nr:phage tail protein [uncultured Mediterranean phage uvMED]